MANTGKDLTAANNRYLLALRDLDGDQRGVRCVSIAEALGVSKPSVSHAVKLLREGGFLTKDSDHFLHLTALGQETAEKLYERYQFFAKHLAGAGVDTAIAEEEACRMEHTISHESFHVLKEQKQNTCPFADSCQLVTESKNSTKEDN